MNDVSARFAAPLVLLAFCAVSLQGCSHHALPVPQPATPPGMDSHHLATSARASERHLIPGMPPSGLAADGSYHVHTLHVPGVSLHHIVSYTTPNGCFTQAEYLTPFGMLTIMQAPKRVAPAPPSASASTDDAEDVVARGKNSHGAAWMILRDSSQPHGDYSVHVEFPNSTLDVDIPSSAQVAVIKGALEELY